MRKSSPPPPKPNEKTRERLLDLWREALPLEGTPALSYLSYRGLDPKRVLPVEDLRFHPHLEYREGGRLWDTSPLSWLGWSILLTAW